MHPGQRLSYALVLSLALWWPTLQAALGGGVDPLDASIRWVLAFAVASAGVRLVGGLVDRYADVDDDDPVLEGQENGSVHLGLENETVGSR